MKHPELVRSVVLVEPPLLRWLPKLPGGQRLYDDFMNKMWDPTGRGTRPQAGRTRIRQAYDARDHRMARMKKKKLTDDEMDALVIADIGDESAWGEPVPVGPSKSPRPAWIAQAKHLDLAAKFFVLSVLHRMGVEATVTFSQSDNVDITVVHESGRVLTVDVKTLRGTKEWTVGPFRATDHHYIVFVSYPANGKPSTQPNVYVVASERLERFLARKQVRSLSMDALAKELAARDAWQELAIAPAA